MKTEDRKQKSVFFFLFFCLWFAVCGLEPAFANNIAVENVSLTDKDTTNDTYDIQFDIAWDNSWFITGAPSSTANWDAAWVFAKFSKSTDGGATWSDWAHCTLLNTGSIAPTGSQMSFGDTSGVYKGAFIYRSSAGSGSVDWNDAEIRWAYGTDGVSDTSTVKIKLFAIEMAYIPTANFYVGDGTNNPSGSNSHFFDAADAADPRDPVLITSTQPYISNVYNGTGTAGDITWQNESTYAGNLPASRTQLGANYPTGYNAFYIMKYEISQKQYADFLNTLTSSQASSRNPGASTYRYTISGSWPNFSASAPDRACNWLKWEDVIAYADWAGLRPFSELEFEKAARGGQTVVNGEYAWGTGNIASAAYTLEYSGAANEGIATNYSTTSGYGNCSYSTTDGSIDGPLRCGIFAANASNTGRVTSGGSYYGVMELSGNLWERPVSVMDSQTGTTISDFAGSHGDGDLSTVVPSDWPPGSTAQGVGFRGGYWVDVATLARVSDRDYAAYAAAGRSYGYGGRCARTSP